MTRTEPITTLDARYSSAGAAATSWAQGRALLEAAEVFWLSTVRPDDRPHVTPLIAVWHGDALHFCTGADERKARNLEHNPHCVLTTGCNRLGEGLDVVVEGQARRVRDETRLHAIAGAYLAKYGDSWAFRVRDGAFDHGDGGRALVFEVRPETAFGFAKGVYSQTRWRFGDG